MSAAGERLAELRTDPRTKVGQRLRLDLSGLDRNMLLDGIEAVLVYSERVGLTDWGSAQLTVALDRDPDGKPRVPLGLVVEVRGRVGKWPLAGEV